MTKFFKKENTYLVIGVCLVLFAFMFGISALSTYNWFFVIISLIAAISGTIILINVIDENDE
tara:strand:+ start:96 stop:281 length:186 start_codon:yes stop_codon:yes gene_type:complete